MQKNCLERTFKFQHEDEQDKTLSDSQERCSCFVRTENSRIRGNQRITTSEEVLLTLRRKIPPQILLFKDIRYDQEGIQNICIPNMPNIGVLKQSKRKLLGCVVNSASVWCKVIRNQRLTGKLARIQRLINIRIACAYRTISAKGVGLIAGTPPIQLVIQEL